MGKRWFKLNKFAMTIYDFDASLLRKKWIVTHDIAGKKRNAVRIALILHSSESFDNLRQWSRWAHELRIVGRGAPYPNPHASLAAWLTATDITKQSRGMPCAEVTRMLQSLRAVCAAFDDAWAQHLVGTLLAPHC